VQGSAVGELGGEDPVLMVEFSYVVAGADVGIEALGVFLEVGYDVIAVGVAVGVAGERQAGQGRVAGRGEQGERFVVLRPSTGRGVASFENDWFDPQFANRMGGGEAGVAGADDEGVDEVHPMIISLFRDLMK
jgi:hypothetical protein